MLDLNSEYEVKYRTEITKDKFIDRVESEFRELRDKFKLIKCTDYYFFRSNSGFLRFRKENLGETITFKEEAKDNSVRKEIDINFKELFSTISLSQVKDIAKILELDKSFSIRKDLVIFEPINGKEISWYRVDGKVSFIEVEFKNKTAFINSEKQLIKQLDLFAKDIFGRKIHRELSSLFSIYSPKEQFKYTECKL